MHAFLLIGKGENLKREVTFLAKKLGAQEFEYPLGKIEDVRSLNSFVSLTVTAPTAIVIHGVDEATPEAQSAFLKNLEEPQENLYYILTAASERLLLPTLVSRCQVIRIREEASPEANTKLAEDFLKKGPAEKLKFLEPIREREAAKEWVESFTLGLHGLIKEGEEDYKALAEAAKASELTLLRLKANGNVTLQLTNLVVSIS